MMRQMNGGGPSSGFFNHPLQADETAAAAWGYSGKDK